MKKESINKHKLPDFEKLDYEFEISSIEDEEFILRAVRRKVYEKLETTEKMIEDILQPSGLSAMIEVKEIDEEDVKKAFDIYKIIMIHLRKATKLFFNDSDKENIQWINDVYEDWEKIKTDVLILNNKLTEVWSKPTTKKETIGYLG